MNQSAEYEYSAEYKAAVEAMWKEEIRAAQDNVTRAAVARFMTGKLAAPEVEAYIDALHEYIRRLEVFLDPEERMH